MFLLSIYISRSLGADDFGIFSLYISLLLPLSMISRLGLENNLMRLISKDEFPLTAAQSLFHKAVLIVTLASLGIALSLYIIGYLLPTNGGSENFKAILPGLALGLPFHALLFTLIYYYRGRHRIFISMAFENIVLYFVFLLYLLVFGQFYPFPSIPFGMSLSIGISLFVALLFYRLREAEAFDRPTPTLPTTSEQLRDSIPILTTSLSTLAFVTLDIFLLSLFLESAEVGIYAAAAKLVAFVSFPLMGVIGMIAPRLSALDNKGDRSALERVFRQSSGFAFWCSLPVVLIIALFPEFLLGFFGEGFEKAKDVIFILLLGHVVTIMLGPIGYLLWMTGHARELQRVTLISLAATVAACLLLIPLLGINGAATGITVGLLIKGLGAWRLVINHLEFNPLYLPWDGLINVVYRKY